MDIEEFQLVCMTAVNLVRLQNKTRCSKDGHKLCSLGQKRDNNTITPPLFDGQFGLNRDFVLVLKI